MTVTTLVPESDGWTPEQDAQLRALRAQEPPVSYGEIGKLLGVSKNSALSRAHRIGLNGGAAANPANRKGPLKVIPAKETTVGSSPSLGLAGDDRGCRWPLWGDKEPINFKFCCAAKAGPLPYCIEHTKKAYAPALPLRPRAVRA